MGGDPVGRALGRCSRSRLRVPIREVVTSAHEVSVPIPPSEPSRLGDDVAERARPDPFSRHSSSSSRSREIEDPDVLAAVRAIWQRARGDVLLRVTTLELDVRALEVGRLDAATRAKAAGEAHKLAGSAGTFGFARASALAREVENLLAPDADLAGEQAPHLRELLTALRAELEADSADAAGGFSSARPASTDSSRRDSGR